MFDLSGTTGVFYLTGIKECHESDPDVNVHLTRIMYFLSNAVHFVDGKLTPLERALQSFNRLHLLITDDIEKDAMLFKTLLEEQVCVVVFVSEDSSVELQIIPNLAQLPYIAEILLCLY